MAADMTNRMLHAHNSWRPPRGWKLCTFCVKWKPGRHMARTGICTKCADRGASLPEASETTGRLNGPNVIRARTSGQAPRPVRAT